MSVNKEISELNEASELSGSDMLVVSQSGSSEATRTTVSDLATAVGELNEAGALSELSLSMSVGKNLLAQNLNEKGITASPTESLVSLADKVGSLANEGPVRTKYLYHTLDTTVGETDDGHGLSSNNEYFYQLKDGYIAYFTASKLYIAQDTGNKNLEYLKEHAVASCVLTENVNSGTNFAFSDDCTKFIVGANGSTSSGSQRPVRYFIYDITWENGAPTAITFLKERQTAETSSSQYFYCPSITNDAKFVAFRYASPSSSSAYIRIESTFDSTVYATISGSASYKTDLRTLFKGYDGDSSSFVVMHLYSSTYGYWYFATYPVTFTYDGETGLPSAITIGSAVNKQIDLFGKAQVYLVDVYNSMIYQTESYAKEATTVGSVDLLDGTYGYVSVIDFSNLNDIILVTNQVNKYKCLFVYQNTSGIPSSDSNGCGFSMNRYNSNYGYRHYLSFTLPVKDGTEFSFELFPVGINYTYDRANHTLTADQTVGSYIKLFTYNSQSVISFGAGPSTFPMIVLGEDDNGYVWGKSSGDLQESAAMCYNVKYSTTTAEYLYAIKLTSETGYDFIIYPLYVSSLNNIKKRTYTPIPTSSI